jgi:diketogulonate reductase-like aldo/keto reductase
LVAIPRTASEAHADENIGILDFALSNDEVKQIDALAQPDGRLLNPPGLAPIWD